MDNIPPLDLHEDPLNYQDQVLAYLSAQEQYPEDHYSLIEVPCASTYHPEESARAILDEILSRVDDITLFKEAFEKTRKGHNQYELFNMSKIVEDFNIEPRLFEKLAFREALVVSVFKNSGGPPIPVGGLCLDIQSVRGGKFEHSNGFSDFNQSIMRACEEIKDKHENISEVKLELQVYETFLKKEMKRELNKFIIHLSSQINVNERNGGSFITTEVDKKLHTLEERRKEFIALEDGTVHKKMCYVGLQKDHYIVKTEDSKEQIGKEFCYSFANAEKYISEGANFLLLRYLALTKYIGVFEMSTMYIDGSICRNIYECDGPFGGTVNEVQLDLCKIYRTVIEQCGITHKISTILTLDGARIIKQEWQTCDYILEIIPKKGFTGMKPNLVIRLNEVWKYDIQLFSRYLDEKTGAFLKMKSYMKDHQEILNLISDYVQNILQLKPENIINFTGDYFSSFAPYYLPENEYVNKNE